MVRGLLIVAALVSRNDAGGSWPRAMVASIRERIGAWNRLGRELCGRFPCMAAAGR